MALKTKDAVVLLIFVLLLVSSAGAVFKSYECRDQGPPPDDSECADGNRPRVMCDDNPVIGNCKYICAAKCGAMTACASGDCENCCAAEMCSKYSDTGRKQACIESCKGTCLANTQFCDIIEIMQAIGGGLAVVMLMINGIKWMMLADDPAGRQDARRGVWYVFIGLGIMLVSFAFVSFILTGDITC